MSFSHLRNKNQFAGIVWFTHKQSSILCRKKKIKINHQHNWHCWVPTTVYMCVSNVMQLLRVSSSHPPFALCITQYALTKGSWSTLKIFFPVMHARISHTANTANYHYHVLKYSVVIALHALISSFTFDQKIIFCLCIENSTLYSLWIHNILHCYFYLLWLTDWTTTMDKKCGQSKPSTSNN